MSLNSGRLRGERRQPSRDEVDKRDAGDDLRHEGPADNGGNGPTE